MAARDLGISVVTPFRLKLEAGHELLCEAFVPDFGSPHGALVLGMDHEYADAVRRVGHWVSLLGPIYRNYSRSLFIETLVDWGWFGERASAPAWYTGRASS